MDKQTDKPGFWKKAGMFTHRIYLVFRSSWKQFFTGLALILTGIFFFFWATPPALNVNFTMKWDWWLEAYISFATLIVAVLIWYNEKKRQWEESLSKRLTVHFKKGENFVMTCHETYLAGEGDIRAWGQQIGAQMSEEQKLKFYPYITQEKPDIIQNSYKLYQVTFYLIKIPENVSDKYLVWIDNLDDSPENTPVLFEGHPKKPVCIEEARAKWIEDNTENKPPSEPVEK